MDKCPFCAEIIDKDTTTCPHCKENLSRPEKESTKDKKPKLPLLADMNIYQRIVLMSGGVILLGVAGNMQKVGLATVISVLGATGLFFLAFKNNK